MIKAKGLVGLPFDMIQMKTYLVRDILASNSQASPSLRQPEGQRRNGARVVMWHSCGVM